MNTTKLCPTCHGAKYFDTPGGIADCWTCDGVGTINEVSDRPFDILLDGKPEMILWAKDEAHARSLAMIEFDKRGETAKHFHKSLRAVARHA